MNKEPLTLGQYIKKFCSLNNIFVRDFIKDTGFRVYPLDINARITLQTYFRLAEYMSRKSNMPLEFYLLRLKNIYENNIYKRDIGERKWKN